MQSQKDEFEAKMKRQKDNSEKHNIELENQMNQKKLMFEQMNLPQKKKKGNWWKRQRILMKTWWKRRRNPKIKETTWNASKTSSAENNEKEWFQYFFNYKSINKLIQNYLLISKSSFILNSF